MDRWDWWESERIICPRCSFQRTAESSKAQFVPQEALDFLQINVMCWGCRNVLNAYVIGRFNACWGSSNYRVIQLAIVSYLHGELISTSRRSTYLKCMQTRDLHRGQNVP